MLWFSLSLSICVFTQRASQTNYYKTAFFRTITSDDVSASSLLLASFHPVSQVACSQYCLRDARCKYRKYRPDINKCELLQSISEKDVEENSFLSKRHITTFCMSQPENICKEKCKCVDTNDTTRYRCDCSGQDVHRSCKEALEANNNETKKYWIQLSMSRGAVQIKCALDNSTGQTFAVFHHDAENYTKVTGYPDYDGAYQKNFVYFVAMENIISMIHRSDYCYQFTFARCKGLWFVTRHATWLKGRNGLRLKYWGGGPSNGIGCACGITNTCINNAYKCNCDVNDDYNYYIDQGNVVDKTVLPITGIAVGDTVSTNVEVLFYIVGPLICRN